MGTGSRPTLADGRIIFPGWPGACPLFRAASHGGRGPARRASEMGTGSRPTLANGRIIFPGWPGACPLFRAASADGIYSSTRRRRAARKRPQRDFASIGFLEPPLLGEPGRILIKQLPRIDPITGERTAAEVVNKAISRHGQRKPGAAPAQPNHHHQKNPARTARRDRRSWNRRPAS